LRAPLYARSAGSERSPEPDLSAVVDAMLAAAGLSPEATEREDLIATYAMFKPVVEALYAVPEARYEAPALVFQAAPKLTPWGA
jgi:hypothetical protein